MKKSFIDMTLLKYSIYKNLLKNELTKEELTELIKFVYIVILTYQKYNQLNNPNLKQEELEEITINKTSEFLSKNGKSSPLLKQLKINKTNIKNEVDFNYWLIKQIT